MDGEELDEFIVKQLTEIDRMVENLPKMKNTLKRTRTCNGDEQLGDSKVVNKKSNQNHSNDLASSQFGELTISQLNSIDQEEKKVTSKQQQKMDTNANQPKRDTNIVTAEQLELAAALFDDDDDYREPSLDHLDCLISRFKHDRFREKQWEIIRAVMIEKRDVCAVMATGYGKSLCFQVVYFVFAFLLYKKIQILFR